MSANEDATFNVKELVHSIRSSQRHADRTFAADASTVSALTVEEELGTISETSTYTTRKILSCAANKPVIVARTSLEARLSERSKVMGLNNLQLQKLPFCGRQNELEALTNAFFKIQKGERGLLLVGGISGTGKTSLIEHPSFQRKVWSNGGIFISAKCDLRDQNEPLASVQDAMSVLSERILKLQKRKDLPTKPSCLADTLTESTSSQTQSMSTNSSVSAPSFGSGSLSHMSTLEDVQEKLAKEVTEGEWKVLVQTVPAMEALVINSSTSLKEPIADENQTTSDSADRTVAINKVLHPKMDGSSMKENSDQLKFAYRHFIRVVATVCPLVIIFDDCQWQDKASMEWMKSILTDTSKAKDDASASLLFIASYRSDEVDDDHGFMRMTKELQSMLPKQYDIGPVKPPTGEIISSSIPLFVQQINIGNLRVLDIVEILEELLRSNAKDVVELAEILHKKSKCDSELF
jgi:hypothetical protein